MTVREIMKMERAAKAEWVEIMKTHTDRDKYPPNPEDVYWQWCGWAKLVRWDLPDNYDEVINIEKEARKCYQHFHGLGNFPGMPFFPEDIYDEWESYMLFLNWDKDYEKKRKKVKISASFPIIEKEKQAKKHWDSLLQNNEIPDEIPAEPDKVYSEQWEGWAKFVGWFIPEWN